MEDFATHVSAGYDVAGNMTCLTYPDGRVVAQQFDSAGRTAAVSYSSWNGTAVNTPYFAVDPTSGYDPASHLVSAVYGNGVPYRAGYDNRERLASMAYGTTDYQLWSKQYSYTPNSNLQAITDGNSGVQRRFGYDGLNRLTNAQDFTSASSSSLATNGLNEQYFYDYAGNLGINGNATPNYPNNQNPIFSYDPAGNQLGDGIHPAMLWDAENRFSAIYGVIANVYDGEGQRVEKYVPVPGLTDTGFIVSVYFGGKPITRIYNGQSTDLVYGPTGLLAEVPGTQTAAPVYHLADHLGSSIGDLQPNGALANALDYRPFGGILSGSTTDPYQFTGKERDAETGNDYFGARYYSSAMGRFTSPDWSPNAAAIPYAQMLDPQSFNLYSYVRNNPLRGIDIDGHSACLASSLCTTETNQDADTDAAYDRKVRQTAIQEVHASQAQQMNRQPDGSYKATPDQIAEIKADNGKKTITTKKDPLGQCVTACKHFTGVPGPTGSWIAGRQASDLTDKDIGTAIATFGPDGHYPTSGHMNSATFMGTSVGGIWVADQWPGQTPVRIWFMKTNDPNNPGNASMNASSYRVITVPQP